MSVSSNFCCNTQFGLHQVIIILQRQKRGRREGGAMSFLEQMTNVRFSVNINKMNINKIQTQLICWLSGLAMFVQFSCFAFSNPPTMSPCLFPDWQFRPKQRSVAKQTGGNRKTGADLKKKNSSRLQ